MLVDVLRNMAKFFVFEEIEDIRAALAYTDYAIEYHGKGRATLWHRSGTGVTLVSKDLSDS